MKYFPDAPVAVFFDMDGLLVDTEPYWLQAERELMAEFDVAWQESDQLYCLGGPMEKVGRYMAELAGGKEDPEWFASELIERMAVKFDEVTLMPGVADLLAEITQFKMPSALVSASPRRLVDSVLSSVESHPFTLSISAEDVKKGKPHPDPYLRAAELLEVDINSSLIIEDSPTGVAAARSSGAWVIAVPHIASIQEHEKSAIINSLEGHSLNSLWSLVRSR